MTRTKSHQKSIFIKKTNLLKIQIILIALFFAIIFFPLTGCSRQRYRQQADSDVNELLATVGRNKRWELINYSLQPNQQSRFFDPYNPDCEPMPPDDATAHHYMHCVDGKRNGDWDANGRTNFVENPYWQRYLPLNDEGSVTLDKETAFQLAQTHSPEYQTALENLYMSALQVSMQRYQFDTQFYGGSSMFYTTGGAVRDSWTNSSKIGFDKKLATGGQAVVELANSITWQVGGSDPTAYNTLLSASFLQPFLRNGGREYVLESLTRSERNLLANVRQMAFYRQGFYKTVIFGGNNVGMPSASGSPNSSNSGTNLSGGYISLLASQRRISNQRNNVISKRNSEKQFQALFDAGRGIGYIQIESARASYLDSQSQLMSQINSYNSSVEQFVTNRLGLPPDLRVQIKDPLLKQFEIMSPELTAIQDGLESHYLVIRDKQQQIPDTLIEELNALCDQLKGEIANVYADIDKLEAKIPERISNIRFLEQQTEQFEGYIDPASFSEQTFVERVVHLRQEVPKLENDLRMTSRLIENVRKIRRNDLVTMLNMGRIDPESTEYLMALKMQNTLNSTQLPTGADPRSLTDAQKDPYRHLLTQVMRKLTGDVRQLSLEQARARLDAISMTPIDITPETAIKVASQYRLDWMNARADLVNSWRDIEIAANKLQSVLNVRVNGEIGTVGSNPLAFNSQRGKVNVGVEWDAPLTRLIERNDYRTAQIRYQQARRSYYNYVDNVNRTLRDSLRNIDNVQFDFEVQRRAVLVAISRVHLAQLAMEEPPKVGQTSENMSNTLARDLVESLNSLLDAQNRFMAIWVDHYGMRSALCLDLGIMQLDENGIWLDPGSVREADYNQLVSRDRENTSSTLPIAPPMPVGMILRPVPGVSDADGMIYPQELRQGPPAPKLLVPTEMLPSGVTQVPVAPAPNPSLTLRPMPMMPSELLILEEPPVEDYAPSAPRPSPLPIPNEDATETPETQAPAEQPVLQRRAPSPAVLQNYGVESLHQYPEFEEEPVDLSHYTTQPVAYHSAQMGAGQSLQNASGPVSVATAMAQPLPMPNSPGNISQVGFRNRISTNNTVYINDAR